MNEHRIQIPESAAQFYIGARLRLAREGTQFIEIEPGQIKAIQIEMNGSDSPLTRSVMAQKTDYSIGAIAGAELGHQRPSQKLAEQYEKVLDIENGTLLRDMTPVNRDDIGTERDTEETGRDVSYIGEGVFRRLLIAPEPEITEIQLDQVGVRPSKRELAQQFGVSVPTMSRRLRKLIEKGSIPLHPRDPRTIDETGLTAHTRILDGMVLEALKRNPNLTNRDLEGLLSDIEEPKVQITQASIHHSRLRLIAQGKIEPRILGRSFYNDLDAEVAKMLKKGSTLDQIASALRQPVDRISASVRRLPYRSDYSGRLLSISEAVRKYLEEHKEKRVSYSEVARFFGVSSELIRQVAEKINDESDLVESSSSVNYTQDELLKKLQVAIDQLEGSQTIEIDMGNSGLSLVPIAFRAARNLNLRIQVTTHGVGSIKIELVGQ